jgi:hypothetical protein
MLHDIGFEEVRIDIDSRSGERIRRWSPVAGLENLVSSALVVATKADGTKS